MSKVLPKLFLLTFCLCLLAAFLLPLWSGRFGWQEQSQQPWRLRRHRHLVRQDAAAAETTTLALGGNSNFSISVLDDRRTILVLHNNGSSSTKTLLEIQNIRAGRGHARIGESRGLFTVRDYVWKRTDDYQVDTVQRQPDDDDDQSVIAVRGALFQTVSLLFWTVRRAPVLRFRVEFSTLPAIMSEQIAFAIRLTALDGDDPPDGYNRVLVTHDSTRDERFFGFGTQFSVLDMKGRDPIIVCSENGIGRGASLNWIFDLVAYRFLGIGGNYDSSYAPMPYYLSNKGRALVLENSEISQFDLTDRDSATIKLFGTEMRGRLMQGDAPLDLIESFTEYSGRMPPLPDWINNGALVGMQGGTDKVLSALAKLQDLQTPIGAFWLQDWVGKRQTIVASQLWWNWVLDENSYPGWSDMVAQLEADGIRVMTYISPFLANVGESAEYEGDVNLYEIAQNRGYLVQDSNGDPYLITNTDFSAGLVDFTNRDAREWYKGIIKTNVIGVGASGYMADYSEALPFDSVLSSGESPATYHNKYPEEWQLVNREAIAELNRTGDIVYFTRGGYTRSPGLTPLMWVGDQMTTWDEQDGLKSAITAILSSGLSGFSINHSDIGGFTGVVVPLLIEIARSRELFLRWTEMNAFTAVYRTHEGSVPDANVQFYTDDETYEHFATFAKVYSALAFYRSTLMEEAADRGYPLVRHPLLHYPNDDRAYKVQYQWMLGAEFMVAPVVDAGQTSVSLYLPEGSWTHVWSQDTFEGPRDLTIGAPISRPPVFFKTGSAVGAQFVANLETSGVLP